MSIRLKRSSIEEAAKSKPPGYLADVLASGTIDGDWIELTPEQYDRIKATYTKGLGDVVKMFAAPVAAVIDSVFGTELKECGACENRRIALNKLGPKIGL